MGAVATKRLISVTQPPPHPRFDARLGYSSAGCFPAEPASASPSTRQNATRAGAKQIGGEGVGESGTRGEGRGTRHEEHEERGEAAGFPVPTKRCAPENESLPGFRGGSFGEFPEFSQQGSNRNCSRAIHAQRFSRTPATGRQANHTPFKSPRKMILPHLGSRVEDRNCLTGFRVDDTCSGPLFQ